MLVVLVVYESTDVNEHWHQVFDLDCQLLKGISIHCSCGIDSPFTMNHSLCLSTVQSIGPLDTAMQLHDRVIPLPLTNPPCENPWWRALGPDQAKDAAEPASWEMAES